VRGSEREPGRGASCAGNPSWHSGKKKPQALRLGRPSLLAPHSSLLFVAFLLVALASQLAHAVSLGEIRSRGDRLAEEAPQAAGDAQRETALVERLGEVVLAYFDESDRLQRAGEEERRATASRAAFEALHAPLDGIYRRHADRLEQMSRAVMEADGDLEALYETADFRSAQQVAANALYYRNWLSYYGARVFDGSRREELLRACESGFSQFAVGDHAAELVDESLLGRGLCYLELGNYDWARRDFETVIGGGASPQRKAKARLALLDAYYRGGDASRAIAYSRELLGGGLVAAEEAPIVRFYELQALLDSADRAKGGEAERHRREASAVMAQLRRAGGAWSAKVDALLAASIDDPSQWAGKADTPAAQWQLAQLFLEKEDCAGAEPLLERLLAGDDVAAASRHREARYWLAVCHFRAQRYDRAAAELGAVLEDGGEPDFAADARYLRFKALEAMMAVDEAPAGLTQRYVSALHDLLDHGPDLDKSAEAHYRLGEYLQAAGEFAAAIDEYAQVASDEALRLRAAFGTVQSRFELLRGATDPTARAALVAAADEDFARYDERAAACAAQAKGDDPAPIPAPELAALNAVVTLLRAVHASLATTDGDRRTAELLADFGERYPEQTELAAQAARMRLAALLRLGRFADAAAEVEKSGAAMRAEGRGEALRGLAAAFAKDGRMSESPDDAAAAARIAVALHGLAGEIGGEAPSRRQRVAIAQLQEKAGQLDDAAAGYRAVLADNPNDLAALRGLARIAESRGQPQAALDHWVKYTETVRAGDSGWFRGQYEQARLQLVVGDRDATCRRLAALRTAMPGLQDEEIRAALKQLYEDAGC
jgi:hypothetical protein